VAQTNVLATLCEGTSLVTILSLLQDQGLHCYRLLHSGTMTPIEGTMSSLLTPLNRALPLKDLEEDYPDPINYPTWYAIHRLSGLHPMLCKPIFCKKSENELRAKL
jgi:hypothetical protein